MSGQLATRIGPVRPWGQQLVSWGRVAVQRLASGWCLSDTSGSSSEPTRPGGDDVPRPKRGAFPSRPSEAEEAPEYIPDTESEDGPVEADPDATTRAAGHEEA